MSAATEAEELNAVPLVNAVFCAGCETISNSPHDVCTVCGSRSLTSMYRLLGGNLRSAKPAKTGKYNLELTAKVHDVPAYELNHLIQSVTRLAEVGSEVECLHVNVESTGDTEFLKAA